jgi:hypothetical protein
MIDQMKEQFEENLSAAPFEEQGLIYEDLLIWMQGARINYQEWLRSWILVEIKQKFSVIERLEPGVEVYEEEDFAELWALDFHTGTAQLTIPIHWLRDDLEEALKRDWSEEIEQAQRQWARHGLTLGSEAWHLFQRIEKLINAELRAWENKSWYFAEAQD